MSSGFKSHISPKTVYLLISAPKEDISGLNKGPTTTGTLFIIFLNFSVKILWFIPVLQSRIIFMRLWLLPYCIARQNFQKELKFKHRLKLYRYCHLILINIAENTN
jgi:hypothetical protein